jgi:hypothetical protein
MFENTERRISFVLLQGLTVAASPLWRFMATFFTPLSSFRLIIRISRTGCVGGYKQDEQACTKTNEAEDFYQQAPSAYSTVFCLTNIVLTHYGDLFSFRFLKRCNNSKNMYYYANVKLVKYCSRGGKIGGGWYYHLSYRGVGIVGGVWREPEGLQKRRKG